MHKMSIKNKDMLGWKKDKEWYYIDYERGRYILTEKAPEEARRSFEKWKRLNNHTDWNDLD